MYKLELHCHNREVSACSDCPAEKLIEIYWSAGYSGIVSTNHINRGTYQHMEEKSWEEKVDYFMAGFDALRTAAGKGFDVLLGCEINLAPVVPLSRELQEKGWSAYVPNDYLIYGVTEKWLRETGDMRYMPLEELSRRASCTLVAEGRLRVRPAVRVTVNTTVTVELERPDQAAETQQMPIRSAWAR